MSDPRPLSYASDMSTSDKASKKTLPLALATRAAKAAELKVARLLTEARRDLALIARRKGQIVEAFYDIGEALSRLKKREAIAALGRKSFAEVCEKDAKISASQAQRLVDIVRTMSREEAMAVGSTRASALIGLADATPEDDTPGTLMRRRAPLVLPGGKTLDPKRASAREITRASSEIRREHAPKPTRGSRVGDAETSAAEALEKALTKSGASVRTLAGRPGKPATFRFEGVTLATLGAFAAILARVAKRHED